MKSTDDQAISTNDRPYVNRPSRRSFRLGLAVLASTATIAGLVGVASGTASAGVGGECLWAGTGYAQGTQVVAGGWTFGCGTGQGGAAQWSRGSATNRASTVANPGAAANPTGWFSAGAVQPGTEYNDYCVGAQLVSGSEAMYQAVSNGAGGLAWKAAGPIAQWTFSPGTGPVPTSQSASKCAHDPQPWPPQ